MLRIRPLVQDLKKPSKAYFGDAGWDVYSREAIILRAGMRHTFNLRFAIIGKRHQMYRIEGKSGLAVRVGIDTIGNIIDNGYRGEVSATLVNTGKEDFHIKQGDKIAQLVIYIIEDDSDLVINDGEDLKNRNNGGFGSSGR